MLSIKNKKGFTLIELLVVISIIGILSSVVLASLNSARNKGANAAIKEGMANMRSQAELYYDVNGYTGVCTNSTTGIANMLAQATSTGGGPTGDIANYCAADSSNWSAYVQLKTPENGNGYWCVGSSGASKATSSIPSPLSADSCQ